MQVGITPEDALRVTDIQIRRVLLLAQEAARRRLIPVSGVGFSERWQSNED
jgi:hypothetical protein